MYTYIVSLPYKMKYMQIKYLTVHYERTLNFINICHCSVDRHYSESLFI